MGSNSKNRKKLSLIMSAANQEVHIPLQPTNSHPISPTEEYFRSIFDRADEDGDGFITTPELGEMITRNGLTDAPLPPHVVRRIHRIADKDHDGRLNYREFVGMINDPNLQPLFGRYVNKYVKFIVPRKKLAAIRGGDTVDMSDIMYEDEYSCCPPKLGMIIISVIELIFFLIDEFTEKDSTKSASGPMAQIFLYDPTQRDEFWRFLTYMFVHIGHLHLTVNVTVQLGLGVPLEMVHGWWRVLLIYFMGVIAGSLGTSITDPMAKLAGASGGVYSLITAHIATIILNWKEMTFPVVQLIIFLMITIVDVATSIYNRYYAHMDEQIGYMAHFAGALAGLLVGIFVLRNLETTWKENLLWWIAVIVFSVLMLIGIFWNVFYTDYFPVGK